jgi:hypothetical protein
VGLEELIGGDRALRHFHRERQLLIPRGIGLVELRGLLVQALGLAEPLVGPLGDVPEVLEGEADLRFRDAARPRHGLNHVHAALFGDRPFELLAFAGDEDRVAGEQASEDREKEKQRGVHQLVIHPRQANGYDWPMGRPEVWSELEEIYADLERERTLRPSASAPADVLPLRTRPPALDHLRRARLPGGHEASAAAAAGDLPYLKDGLCGVRTIACWVPDLLRPELCLGDGTALREIPRPDQGSIAATDCRTSTPIPRRPGPPAAATA